MHQLGPHNPLHSSPCRQRLDLSSNLKVLRPVRQLFSPTGRRPKLMSVRLPPPDCRPQAFRSLTISSTRELLQRVLVHVGYHARLGHVVDEDNSGAAQL